MGISKSNLKNLWHLWKFFVVSTFLHSDCIQIILISVFSPIPGKYGPKHFWIRIFFTEFRKQRFVWRNTFPILFKTFLVPIKDLSTMEMRSTRKTPLRKKPSGFTKGRCPLFLSNIKKLVWQTAITLSRWSKQKYTRVNVPST